MTIAAPQFQAGAFTCPHCGVYSAMDWFNMTYFWQGHHQVSPLYASKCRHCDAFCYWLSEPHPENGKPVAGKLIVPAASAAPIAHPEMPAAARGPFEEARAVYPISPVGAGLLLRRALRAVCRESGTTGVELTDDIAMLAEKGLPAEIVKAWETADAAADGSDARQTAGAVALLFELINFTVAEMIAKPRQLRSLSERLPGGPTPED